MTYETEEAATDIIAGIHPYDRTVRPQKVTKQNNPGYWTLINKFKNITKIPNKNATNSTRI